MRTLFSSLALVLLLLCACAASPETDRAQAESADLLSQLQQHGEALLESRRTLLSDLLFGRVPESAPADAAWFDSAAFVGDSVSVMLEYYNNAHHPLGSAAFFCAESLSPRNALAAQPGSKRLPEWPKGSGRHPALPEGIAESGAEKVYLMLGMNSISGGVDNAAADLVTLIDSILAQSPEAAVLIQSVTPMTADSPRTDALLNNETIRQYNLRMAEVCRERGWYFVDSAQALTDENGFLRADYSGDKAMGIHLNFSGAEAWANYLLTHVPSDLKTTQKQAGETGAAAEGV